MLRDVAIVINQTNGNKKRYHGKPNGLAGQDTKAGAGVGNKMNVYPTKVFLWVEGEDEIF